jgi:hypothetical protein
VAFGQEIGTQAQTDVLEEVKQRLFFGQIVLSSKAYKYPQKLAALRHQELKDFLIKEQLQGIPPSQRPAFTAKVNLVEDYYEKHWLEDGVKTAQIKQMLKMAP